MRPWKIVVIPTAITLVIASIYIFSIYNKRHNPGVVNQGQQQQPSGPATPAVPRFE